MHDIGLVHFKGFIVSHLKCDTASIKTSLSSLLKSLLDSNFFLPEPFLARHQCYHLREEKLDKRSIVGIQQLIRTSLHFPQTITLFDTKSATYYG
jgi:hypothetical protein